MITPDMWRLFGIDTEADQLLLLHSVKVNYSTIVLVVSGMKANMTE
jgi:hypothetical protein